MFLTTGADEAPSAFLDGSNFGGSSQAVASLSRFFLVVAFCHHVSFAELRMLRRTFPLKS